MAIKDIFRDWLSQKESKEVDHATGGSHQFMATDATTPNSTSNLTNNNIYRESVPPYRATRIHPFPLHRLEAYRILEIMSRDPLIHSALIFHINAVINPDKDGSRIKIVPKDPQDTKNLKYVEEVQNKFEPWINENITSMLFQVLSLGCAFVRVIYENEEEGKSPKGGVKEIMFNDLTHPSKIYYYYDLYERPYGWSHLPSTSLKDIQPYWTLLHIRNPLQLNFNIYNINISYYEKLLKIKELDKTIRETTNYGYSFIQNVYKEWRHMTLLRSNLLDYRKLTILKERFIGVSMGDMDQKKQIEYRQTLAEALRRPPAEKNIDEFAVKSSSDLIRNMIIPLNGDQGSLNFFESSSPPNVKDIEDLMFYVKLICAPLGVDPAMHGFGDQLSGGLGEGGFYRLSSISATISQANKDYIGQLKKIFKYHIFSKYGVFYKEGEEPWEFYYPTLANAYESEKLRNEQEKTNSFLSIATLFQTVDNSLASVDKIALIHYFCKELGFEEDEFKKIISEANIKKNQENFAEEDGFGNSQDKQEPDLDKEEVNKKPDVDKEDVNKEPDVDKEEVNKEDVNKEDVNKEDVNKEPEQGKEEEEEEEEVSTKKKKKNKL